MLQRAVLDQLLPWYVFVVPRQAHGEAKVDLWVWIKLSRAKLDDVAETFLRAVFAKDAVVVVSRAKECQ